VVSGRGLCDELITRQEESYRLWCVVVCDLETSRMRRPWLTLGRSATAKKKRVQWKTPDDGQRNCLKRVEFHSKNKFEKLVHLIGFTRIIRNLKRCTVTWTSDNNNNKNNTNTKESGHICGLTIPVYERWKTLHVSGRAYSVTDFPSTVC